MSERSWFWLRALAILALALAVRPLPAHELPAGDVHYRSPVAAALAALPCIDGRLRGFDPCSASEPGIPANKTDRKLDARTEQEVNGIRRAQHENPTADNDAKLGTVELMTGSVRKAVALLETAVAEVPDGRADDKAAYLNDLSVAYLASAADNAPHDLVRALDAASQAADLAPSLPEPCFNRAVALTRLGLARQAAAAWQGCDASATADEWKAEIERRSAALPAPAPPPEAQGECGVPAAPGDDPNSMRRYALESLLPFWGAAWQAGHTVEAAALARQGAALGDKLHLLTGDSTVAEMFARIAPPGGQDAAADAPPNAPARPATPATLARLAAGVQVYARARCDFGKYDIVAGEAEFEQARAQLGDAAGPLAPWIEQGLISCAFYHDRFDDVMARSEALLAATDEAHHPVLAAYLLWARGMAYTRQGDLPSARRDFEQTRELFERAHEREELGGAYQLVGETDHLLGDEDKAWQERLQGMYLLAETPQSRRRLMLLRDAGEALQAEGRPHAALAFLDAAVEIAAKPRDRAEMLGRRARVAHQLGRSEAALADLEDAGRAADATGDASLHDRVAADLDVARAESVARSDPQGALRLLDAAEASYKRNGHVPPLGAVYLLRAQIQRALKNTDSELEDLTAGIEQFEHQWRSLDNEGMQVSFLGTFLGTALELYDRAISVQSQRAEAAAAFDLAERSRAFWSGWGGAPEAVDPAALRALAAVPAAAAGPPGEGGACVAGAPAGLAADVAIVEYAVERDRLLIWVLTCRGLKFALSGADHDDIDRLASRLRVVAHQGSAPTKAFRMEAAKAYKVLVQPVASWLSRGTKLVFVPDKALYGVPFAALLDLDTDRYLFQEHQVSVAPSAAYFVASARPAAAAGASRYQDALLVSPQPADLVQTPAEVADLRQVYPGATVLTGESVTRRQVLHDLDSHAVLHYAGHAEVNPANPFASRLPLGPRGGDALRMGDLAGPVFNHLDLIVLSACSTVYAAPTRTGGFIGLARPFLSRGAHAVVGTLWDVDDAASRAVVVAFHRALHSPGTATPAAALRAAQQQCLDKKLPPSAWAAFAVVGAGTL